MPRDGQALLFPQDQPENPVAAATAAALPEAAGTPRIHRAQRDQAEMRFESLDQRLAADHPARLVWKLVEGLELSSLYERIRAVAGEPGRNATDPRVLFALWLYAAVEGVGSARKLDKLCRESRPFEWLRGEVPINYHLLADFRVEHQQLLDELLTDSLAGMLAEGLVSLETAALDGMRVRASAGKSSFRRQPSLAEAQQQARSHLEQLRDELHKDAASTQRQQKARERAARERAAREPQERVDKALAHVQEIAQQREARKQGSGVEARASTTDPEARNMKMADGGFRPAFNAQFATDTSSGIIVGMEVINQGTDAAQMKPMVEQIHARVQQRPHNLLADGGFATIDDIEATTQAGTTVYTPVKEEAKQKQEGKNPFERKRGDSSEIAQWRQRMGTEAAKLIYLLRAQTAELTNARMRNMGVYQVTVRGLVKVKAVLLWYVLAQNLLRAEALRAKKADGAGTPSGAAS